MAINQPSQSLPLPPMLFVYLCYFSLKSRTYNWTDNVTFRNKNEREKKIKYLKKNRGPNWNALKRKQKWQRLFSHPQPSVKAAANKKSLHVCDFCLHLEWARNRNIGRRAIGAEVQILWNFLHTAAWFSIDPPHQSPHRSHVILLRIPCLPFLIESNCRPYLPLQFIHKLTISLWTNVMIASIDFCVKNDISIIGWVNFAVIFFCYHAWLLVFRCLVGVRQCDVEINWNRFHWLSDWCESSKYVR